LGTFTGDTVSYPQEMRLVALITLARRVGKGNVER
jgi:hypothetical protein